jgi:hypothetical protein
LIPVKEKGAPRSAFLIKTYFLIFGFVLVAPATFFVDPGTAFFTVAFVAIFVNIFSPSQWSGTLSPKNCFKPETDKVQILELFIPFSDNPVCRYKYIVIFIYSN